MMMLNEFERAILTELKALNGSLAVIAGSIGVDGVRIVLPLEPPTRIVLTEDPPTNVKVTT